jgi:hypothetical protein
MTLWGFLVGLILGIFPCMLLLKQPRLRFIANPYVRGAIWGLCLWGVINVLLFIESRYSLLGVLEGAEGFSSMMILVSSLQGFITSGITAAFILKKFTKFNP